MDLQLLHERYFDRERRRDDPDCWSTSSDQGVVATAHYLASAAGGQMLRRGGNAVDAAIAASFALCVCEPAGSGLGGMAMVVVHLKDENRTFTVEGPCLAPHHATAEKVAASNRYRGYAAIAVPTHVATLDYLHARYATLPIAELLTPAIQLAEEGFPVTATLTNLMQQYAGALRKHSAGRFFLKHDRPYARGERLRQPVLAATLRKLARRGLREFYVGEIGRQMADDIQAGGGFVSRDDLLSIAQPVERRPLSGPLKGDAVHTVGPPGGGLALLQLAQLFTAGEREALLLDRPHDVRLLAAMIRRVRLERRAYRLKHFPDAPGEARRLLETDYNRRLMAEIDDDVSGGGETTHIAIIDGAGNAVALTQSIERSFGSAMATAKLGFCYNGYLRAFKVQNRRHPYFLRPGTPARSNATPTVITRQGAPVTVVGSTGSERMASSIFCTLMRLRTESPFAASHGPRLHCTPEGLVMLEAARFPDEVVAALSSSGHTLEVLDSYSFRMGGLQLVVAEGTRVTGVADPRRDGAAIGP